MTSQTNERVRYELLLPDEKQRPCRFAGYAFKSEDENYYVLRLSMFPNITYFMARNKESSKEYMVFSRCQRKGEGARLLNPVGDGTFNEEDKTYMRLSFYMLPNSIYMSLIPKD